MFIVWDYLLYRLSYSETSTSKTAFHLPEFSPMCKMWKISHVHDISVHVCLLLDILREAMITIDEFLEALRQIRDLDIQQEEVVRFDIAEPLIVVVGPRTGKTTTIAAKALKMVFVDRMDPASLVLPTGTLDIPPKVTPSASFA